MNLKLLSVMIKYFFILFLQVRAVMGPKSYMLTENEELWEKLLDENIETLLK